MQAKLSEKIVSLIDLTSLDDSKTNIVELCKKATTPFGPVASICIYPQFVAEAKTILPAPIHIATVANFPHGNEPLSHVIHTIKMAIQAGALEIDMVFPYTNFLAGEIVTVRKFVEQCKLTCGEKIILKVILETGALRTEELIKAASREALLGGADFLKTSTGKITVGATLSAARTMLMTMKDMSPELGRSVGLKVSGGIRTIATAIEFIELAEQIMGAGWVVSKTFRIGASQLLDIIVSANSTETDR